MAQKQCKKCPWKTSTDPNEIPNGYCPTAHAKLQGTISEPGMFGRLRFMACHETPKGKEKPCVGWLHHQLGVGNNLSLRVAVISKQVSADYQLDGEQHATFEDTLP